MGRTLQQVRESRGESRMQLADALGVSVSEVTDWELGRIAPASAHRRALLAHFALTERDLEVGPPRWHALPEIEAHHTI
jgi:transcriptional regulator with XRE-family HTH domain